MHLEYCLTTAFETFAWAKNRGVKLCQINIYQWKNSQEQRQKQDEA